MLSAADLDRQVALLWQHDGLLGRQDTIYRRQGLSLDEADKMRRADYAAGVRLGLVVNRPSELLIRQYKKRNHGVTIDVGMFRIGYERGRFLDDAVSRGYSTLAVEVRNPTELAEHALDHFLHNPFQIGQTVQTAFGSDYHVMEAQQGRVQLAGQRLFIKPAWVQLSREPQQAFVATSGNMLSPQATTVSMGAQVTTRQSVDPYLLRLNGLPVLEAIPAGEAYLRPGVNPRLR